MLKQNRLKKKKDFERVYKKGRGFKADSLFLKILENKEGFLRVGIVVSKKVSKKAVKRNKIKRRIRNIVRNINLKQGFDIILIAYPNILNKEFYQIKKEIEDLIKKTKCLDL
ncbi:MAG: ribonuclease P protein component [Candidatus Paceibacterota bacterium]